MKDTLNFDFCTLTVYNNHVISVINEGVSLRPEHNDVLTQIAETYFKNQPFVYITNRVHSYSVDPKIYFETSKIPNLVGCAVVSSDYKAKNNAKIEKLFYSKPFEMFKTLDEAKEWANTIVQD